MNFNGLFLELFRMALCGLILWGFGWMCWECRSKPRPEPFKKRRR